MEEYIGELWHRLISRAARREYPDAAITLDEVERSAGVLFRAFGGDPGLRVAPSADTRHGGRRRLFQRMAHSGDKVALAARDAETLHLPAQLALFPEKTLNRDLYLWLTALAARSNEAESDNWLVANQRATLAVLADYPGLEPRYARLVAATLAQRIDPARLPADEAARETAIRQALQTPGSISELPPLIRKKALDIQPVPLWLRPLPEIELKSASGKKQHESAEGGGTEQKGGDKRYQAERTDMPENEAPFLFMFRAESLLSWAEFVKVNRDTDEDPDPDIAEKAENMDKLTLARDNKAVASKVRFDLDLPSAAEDDAPIGEGILLPEWDWKRRQMKPDWCRLQTMESRHAPPIPLPEHLRVGARRLRSQFAALNSAKRWQKNQPEGEELDIETCVRAFADRRAGHAGSMPAYLSRNQQMRDLSCLLLADLSLSTDAGIVDDMRVIDAIRDGMLLFAEALSACNDSFAMYGFSSLKRGNIRFHEIKPFAAAYDAACRGRIAAIRPGYYTRMGAAIRRATTLLEEQPQAQRLMLILSDGKPTDIDAYEGRYAIEDTRMSLIEARRAGIQPFCLTIDSEGADYLPHLFGPGGFLVLRHPQELARRLPLLYSQLTRPG
jgi:nitric oxide reductase NorD protein